MLLNITRYTLYNATLSLWFNDQENNHDQKKNGALILQPKKRLISYLELELSLPGKFLAFCVFINKKRLKIKIISL
jgi:hypothetical protein